MHLDISVIRLSRLGPIKNQIFAYSLVAGTLLLIFAKREDAIMRLVLMSGGLAMYFAGPSFWLYAALKLQATSQEQAVLDNTIRIVDEDRILRTQRKSKKSSRPEPR